MYLWIQLDPFKSLNNIEYFNCDDTDIQEQLKNPKKFLNDRENEILVFDEIHQTENASQILKIAADEFPKLKILATGSSTLIASKKFKDTLTGRKKKCTFLTCSCFGAKVVQCLIRKENSTWRTTSATFKQSFRLGIFFRVVGFLLRKKCTGTF